MADTGAKIDINDDGSIFIAGVDAASRDAAKKCIDIVFVPEVGALPRPRGAADDLRRLRELAPGKDGLVHISKLADHHRIEKVEDAPARWAT